MLFRSYFQFILKYWKHLEKGELFKIKKRPKLSFKSLRKNTILEKQLEEAGMGINNLPIIQRIFYGKKYVKKQNRAKMGGVKKSNVKLNDWEIGKLKDTKIGNYLNEIK